MTNISVELILIFILILINGLFSMSELAVVSARKTRLQALANRGDKGAAKALDLAENPDKFLSTIQVGITGIGILSGVFGGARIAGFLSKKLEKIPFLENSAEPISLGIVVIVITYLSLIVGELVPKRIALAHPETIARLIAGPMMTLSKASKPLITLLTVSTNSLLTLIGFGGKNVSPAITEDEIKTLVEQGGKEGIFDFQEQDLITRVLGFGDRKVNSIMTPRPDIVWLDLSEPFEQNKLKMKEAVHSHLPVAKNNIDNIVGVLHAKDILAMALDLKPVDLTHNLKQPLFIPETADAKQLLEMFKRTGIHIAVVVDEYGMVQGIVTLTDILEAIVGDLPPLDQPEESQAVRREDGSWLVDGLISIQELREIIRIPKLAGEESGNFHTLAGFIMAQLGRVPRASDHFISDSIRYEVVDMDSNRVDKVVIQFLHNNNS